MNNVTIDKLTPGLVVKGLLPNKIVTVKFVQWQGEAVEVTYIDEDGIAGNEIILKGMEPPMEVVEKGRAWSFSADAAIVRLVSEAKRINLAHLFDPHLAIHTSEVQPLPHQIIAVYGEMLQRQPLRFLLADDPGAGKTIMAGLLIKELIARGDLKRCLIVSPGSLSEQWQQEMYDKFNVRFEILTNDRIEASPSGNVFNDMDLVIARLDKLSRNEDLLEKLKLSEWDLIVCDEAHKMSATYFGGEKKETKRYRLGKELSQKCRHFLLMTATPHNGKEEDFQLFMALLDGDRFEGRFRDGVHVSNVNDMMRRMVKEELLKFDGKKLFPERKAYTVTYPLSDLEKVLYEKVTTYVREEFNRVEALERDGRRGTVGFALTILQRRLASSPYAIFTSLKRRRERLERMLREAELLADGREVGVRLNQGLKELSWDEVDDLEDIPADEREDLEDEVIDQATAARTIEELKIEIGTLKHLESLAEKVVATKKDCKWDELSKLMQSQPEMVDNESNRRRKLVIFTEMKDTLTYLSENLRNLLGSEEAVVLIHGGMNREDRLNSQNKFKNLSEVEVLIATDAAGEGINLQQSHLMVNYDLPWNPNRLEQRFGRIHRIGQKEVCHLWNLVAENTREGEVYQALLNKLETEREALGGKVFDVLGQAIPGKELRELMIDAIRYNDLPETRARLETIVHRLDTENIKKIFEDNALSKDSLDSTKVQEIRHEMERAEAKKLQPYHVSEFFREAFLHFGGRMRPRENGRYEVQHVPNLIRQRGRVIGRKAALLPKYDRICFDKNLVHEGKIEAEFICPGHPLLDSVIDLTLEKYRTSLKEGSVLIDDVGDDPEARVLVYLEHSIQDGRTDAAGNRRIISRRFQFVEIFSDGRAKFAGFAPYLNYRVPQDVEIQRSKELINEGWLKRDIEKEARDFAIANIVRRHVEEVKAQREDLIDKTLRAVKARLSQEISYWDNRAYQLKQDEEAGKANAKINSAKAEQRADDLRIRLQDRSRQLDEERKIAALPPKVIGGVLVIPRRLIAANGEADNSQELAENRKRVEMAAMEAVFASENHLGHSPRDVSSDKCGWDIESVDGQTGRLRLIEVKGRVVGSETVTVTRNEIMAGLNKKDGFILAIVEISNGLSGNNTVDRKVTYIHDPFQSEPDFSVTSVNFNIKDLMRQGVNPYD
jgi:superfamily II DNA or RNA helicase